jgi:hypothetical protein
VIDAVTGDPAALLPPREARVAIVDDSEIIRERLTRKLAVRTLAARHSG